MILTPENEKIINKEFAELAPQFKPEFANLQHIGLCKILERTHRDEELYKKHLESERMVPHYRKKTFDSKVRALNQLKYIMKSLPNKN